MDASWYYEKKKTFIPSEVPEWPTGIFLALWVSRLVIGNNDLPVTSCWVVDWAHEPPSMWQVGSHGGDGQRVLVGAGRVGELDGDGFGRPLRDGTVELFDGALRLLALVEADEAYPFGQSWKWGEQQEGPSVPADPRSLRVAIPTCCCQRTHTYQSTSILKYYSYMKT